MSEFDGLIDLIPIDEIAKQLGIDEKEAKAAVKAAVPAIVGGMAANAKDSGGARSLEKALVKHKGQEPRGKAKIAQIDEEDGQRIVSNVFGSKKDDVAAAVASATPNVTQEIIAKVLPIIAPIVIAWVASKFFGKTEAPAEAPAPTPAPAPAQEESSGGGIGDLLGGLLGSKQGQEILGGVLGGLLGGGRK